VFGTGLFETGLEFAAAVDLKGSHREGHVLQQPVQEAPGIVGRGAAIGPHNIPARDHIPGREVLEHHRRHRPHIQPVHLDDIPRMPHTVFLGFSHRIRAPNMPLVAGQAVSHGLSEHTAGFQAAMLLQMDGSDHDWLDDRGPWLVLIAAIDDATGEVPFALFRPAWSRNWPENSPGARWGAWWTNWAWSSSPPTLRKQPWKPPADHSWRNPLRNRRKAKEESAPAFSLNH